MEQAQADPDIYFIVTVGHRPAYSNAGISDTTLQPILDTLADQYSPAARPDGKYLVNVAHHLHNGQVLSPKHGLLHVVDGGGGYEETNNKKNPGTLWLTDHMEVVGHVDEVLAIPGRAAGEYWSARVSRMGCSVVSEIPAFE